MSFNHYKNWSVILENTFLQYTWTLHAKEYTYITRKISPKDIELLVFDYNTNPNNANIQRFDCLEYPNTIIIQREFQNTNLCMVIEKIRILRILHKELTVTGKMSSENTLHSSNGMSIMKLTFEEHLVNCYSIPKLLISEIKKVTNLEGYNYANDEYKTKTDINLSYYEDADILTINFSRKINVIHDYCEYINGLLVCYIPNDRIISVQIFQASNILCSHLFDYDEVINNQPPLHLHSIYCEDHDELNIYFTDDLSTKRLKCIEKDKDVFLQISNNDKLIGLLFRNAKNRIAKDFSQEDRERLIENYNIRIMLG
ncbi:2991_t:CDS:2 [Funneliformis geosporum]|uniref:8545_t:CDS:1 n=1 Tax=Funneliformis geosporum TaxID=1117311 RepID=A0A9W4SVR6_9GLOM|nr:8545_t:CDS:2 [Funneliformis geosporum]CAI2183435.1 2991_t:CDS:2 [Funneliformis geosporum]